MTNTSIPYAFGIAAASVELMKAYFKRGSVTHLIFIVAGFVVPLLGGILTLVFQSEKGWGIILLSVLFGVFSLLNGVVLIKTGLVWWCRYKIRNQVPDIEMGYQGCIETGSLVDFKKLIRKKYPDAKLSDSLLRDTLGYGDLTDTVPPVSPVPSDSPVPSVPLVSSDSPVPSVPLVSSDPPVSSALPASPNAPIAPANRNLTRCLEEIVKTTCPNDLESCQKAKAKLQALLLAAYCSGIENSGKVIGEYLCKTRIVLSCDEDIKACNVVGGPEKWKVTFSAEILAIHPGSSIIRHHHKGRKGVMLVTIMS